MPPDCASLHPGYGFKREEGTLTGKKTLLVAALCSAFLLATPPARAADATYDRLVNPEPQNWLMNHHDYTAQRFSALDSINRSNIKNLKLLFAVALGGTSANEYL